MSHSTLEKRIKKIEDRCCCQPFGITQGPPSGAPENNQTVLFDPNTGILYYWNGSVWLTTEATVSVIGITTDSPPVAAPVDDDPTILFNLTTGVVYYWDGDSWEIANPPDTDTDTNLFTGNLTNIFGDIVHDANGHDFQIDNCPLFWIATGNPDTYIAVSNAGVNRSANLLAGGASLIASNLGVFFATGAGGGFFHIRKSDGEVRIESFTGRYLIGSGLGGNLPPVNDVDVTHGLGINAADNIVYRTTKASVEGHTHVAADVTDFQTASRTAVVTNGINDGVTDKSPSEDAVFDALANKSDVGHTHVAADVTDFQTASRTAVVTNGINDGVTDKAPSEDAVFDALALKADLTALDNLKLDQFGVTLEGAAGGVLTTGYKTRYVIPYAGTITGWTILEISDTPITSSIVVDVKLGTYANYDTTPTFASIAGTEKPTITTDVKGQDLTLTTWTTAVAVGDIFDFSIDSVTDAKKVLVLIHITRT